MASSVRRSNSAYESGPWSAPPAFEDRVEDHVLIPGPAGDPDRLQGEVDVTTVAAEGQFARERGEHERALRTVVMADGIEGGFEDGDTFGVDPADGGVAAVVGERGRDEKVAIFELLGEPCGVEQAPR